MFEWILYLIASYIWAWTGWGFWGKEIVRDYVVVLCTFDLFGMKGVLSSALMVCSQGCQGTTAATLYGHMIWNGCSQRDPQHRMGRAETTLIRSLLQFCQWLYTSGLSSSELSGLCCNQDPDTHSTAYQSLKEKSGMRIYCGSEATSHRIAHVTELLHYGPAFPQAQHHGLDGSQAHMSGSEQRIQSGFWENLLRFCCTGCSTNSHQQLCRPCSVPGWCPCCERWHPHLFPGFCPAPHLQAHPEHQTSRALTPLLPLTDFLLATHACNSRQS